MRSGINQKFPCPLFAASPCAATFKSSSKTCSLLEMAILQFFQKYCSRTVERRGRKECARRKSGLRAACRRSSPFAHTLTSINCSCPASGQKGTHGVSKFESSLGSPRRRAAASRTQSRFPRRALLASPDAPPSGYSIFLTALALLGPLPRPVSITTKHVWTVASILKMCSPWSNPMPSRGSPIRHRARRDSPVNFAK